MVRLALNKRWIWYGRGRKVAYKKQHIARGMASLTQLLPLGVGCPCTARLASTQSSVQIVQIGSVNFAVGRPKDSGVQDVGSGKIGLDVDFSKHALAKVMEVLKRC